ncbi:MAG: NPCBM/NEW2 domain-containing protein [Thermodesulfobacteriota bacterium]
MKRILAIAALAVCAALLFTLPAFADMLIRLTSGQVLTVPVNKMDIESISFSGGGAVPVSNVTYLSDLEPNSSTVGWGSMERDIFAGRYKIRLGGQEYQKGLHTHSPANVVYNLGGKFSRFESYVGLWDSGNPNRGKSDDFAGTKGSVVFRVLGDGRELFNSGRMTWEATKQVSVSVAGVQTLTLIVEDAGDGYGWDWAVWGDARLLR